MKRAIFSICTAVLLAMTVACAQLGLEAKSTDQKIAAGYVTVQTIANTALQLGQAGKLTRADAKSIVATNDALLLGLDTARELQKTDPAAATNRMQQIAVSLTALQAYLATKGAK